MFINEDHMIHVPKSRAILSSVAGSTSLACWIVLLLPQLVEQWQTQSAEGISMGFLLIWLLGDICNLSGAILGNLLPEVILLAIWYCLADSLILGSYFYYQRLARLRQLRAKQRTDSNERESADPTRPLLSRRSSAAVNNVSSADTHHDDSRRSDYTARRSSLDSLLSEVIDGTNIWKGIIFPILFVIGCGVLGFLFSSKSTDDITVPERPDDEKSDTIPLILGYLSAIFYLGARIPQIIRNHRRKSVYGLSLLFFVFSVMGNITYAAQILIYRQDKAWIVLNFSWLLGSLGTIFEDAIIFAQFYKYRGHDHAVE